MKLILVRHGETDCNKNNKIISYSNPPLNSNGIKQAKIVAEKLKNENFDFIYSSPLKRALDTAKEINKYHGVKIIKSDLLKERNYGDFEKSNYYELDLRKIRDENSYKKYNMETPEEFENRIKKFLDEPIFKKHGKKILIVAHSGTIKMLLFHLLKIKESFEIFRKKVRKENTSISSIEFDKDFNIIDFKIADNEHLI